MTLSILNRPSLESLSIDSNLSPAQIETDPILCTFAEEASNWKSLASMVLGGIAYRAGKMTALRLIGNTFGNIQKIPFFVNTLSHLSGLFSEVSIFTLSHRSIETLTSQNSSHALWGKKV